NIGASGFDMAPGFTKAGTWYDYFTGESMNVTDAAGHSIYFGPGDYHVFTSLHMDAPFNHLSVKVIEKVGGNAIAQAKVTLNNLAERLTNSSGDANFLAPPQPFAIKVEKFGFLPQTITQTLTSDLQLTIVLEVDMSATPENEALAQVKVFPNPGSG
ncbi:carboxypeptidase regulatory-like domain-containing protein, partial [bacterium]|nr:carboxypeptidase regulatory-like domain-containing protein [bacterium]